MKRYFHNLNYPYLFKTNLPGYIVYCILKLPARQIHILYDLQRFDGLRDIQEIIVLYHIVHNTAYYRAEWSSCHPDAYQTTNVRDSSISLSFFHLEYV